ncbi:MAG: tetratricopeptide repeat protein, partial [Trueperaceae bacterium]|nr:tetratricopeptide repeat protein [Trueperaceae bacterium]
GEILLEAGQASRALRYLQHSQKLAHQIGATEIELYANKLLGKCHLALKDTSKALSHLESALSLSRKINMKLEQSLCHKEIAETYKSLGEYQKALAHFEKFHHLDKEIFNEQSDRNLKQLQLLISDKSK